MGLARVGVLALAGVLGSCGGDDRGTATSAYTGAIDPTGGGTGIDPGGDDGGGDGGIKLDVTPGDGTGMGSAEAGDNSGCDKVDFLFVIDSSPSMADEQVNLLSSFPGFIKAIQDTLMLDDFHLMVVDAGTIIGGGCDGTLGAGQVKSGMGQDCGLTAGVRYATQDQADLATTFSCMGARGYMGDGDELTMDSLTASITTLDADGQCNAGFLRDDAILVITIITDEEDDPNDTVPAPPLDGSCSPADDDPNSAGDPDSWATTIVNAKNGDESSVVILALLGDCDIGGECAGIKLDPFDPSAPITGAEPAPRLRDFAGHFGYSTVASVCSPDYTPFFLEAVSVIDTACTGFNPPG